MLTIFLDLRLKNKILKAEKTLDYLSDKLSEAKLSMDIKAKNAAEFFALKQNILSQQEFKLQSGRLEEFRTSIEKLTVNHELEKYYELIKSNKLKKSEYEKNYPRI